MARGAPEKSTRILARHLLCNSWTSMCSGLPLEVGDSEFCWDLDVKKRRKKRPYICVDVKYTFM
jgi:hypothetical protein